jgi:RHS repeat-associated protein
MGTNTYGCACDRVGVHYAYDDGTREYDGGEYDYEASDHVRLGDGRACIGDVSLDPRGCDPPGNTAVMTGTASKSVIFWFSSKRQDRESGLYYYGYRFYSPTLGRWVSRDPLGERGAKKTLLHALRRLVSGMIGQDKNVFVFVRNDPVALCDPIGLMATPPAPTPPPPSTDPCVEAQKKLTINADEAGARVCHNGKQLGCVWKKDQEKYKHHPGLLKCAQAHEDEHLKQNPNFECAPCGTYYCPIDDPKKKPKGECDAYGVELDCLKKEQKSECGTDYDDNEDPGEMSACEKDYWMAITNVESQKKKYCKTGEGKRTVGPMGALIGDDL